MIRSGDRQVVKAVEVKKIILHEGEPGLNFNGGSYDEIKYIIKGEDGKTYVSFWSSSDFDYCPLWGFYQDCVNCSYWWERQLYSYCQDCEGGLSCAECVESILPCQHPDAVILELPSGWWLLGIPEE